MVWEGITPQSVYIYMLMMKFYLLITFMAFSLLSCKSGQQGAEAPQKNTFQLTPEQAERLASLPLQCLRQEYPNKLGQVLGSAGDLGEPAQLHPAFYGCFDWHSSVHGH